MDLIQAKTFDEERALYGSSDLKVVDCAFDGPADGESAFKESRDIVVEDCFFNLRYPFWHDHRLTIRNCEMTDKCRAALWYSDDILIESTKLHGIKALRECACADLIGCSIESPEFGWSTARVSMTDCTASGEYFLMRASDVVLLRVNLDGKYSFQYVRSGSIKDCHFKTKDSLWHSENVVVKNSVLEGEYLAWYSKNLTLINCTIKGTQPFCYCEGLKLIDCTMEETDLAFEKSDVHAAVNSHIDSVKNPTSGKIVARSIGETILDDPHSSCIIEIDD